MPYVVRCKLCGFDHPYASYSLGMNCENCGTDKDGKGQELTPDNVRLVLVQRSNVQADPLEGQ